MKKRLSQADKFLLEFYLKEFLDGMYFEEEGQMYYTPESLLVTMDKADYDNLRKILSK